MFELNPNLEVKTEIFLETPIFTIDNFYKNPDEVHDYLFNREIPLWKMDEKPSYNSIHFFDRRFEKMDDRLTPVLGFLSYLCNQDAASHHIVTNVQRFFRHDFNDYKNCYWWPHQDGGYNGIVYFNKGDNTCGTNLYSVIKDQDEMVPEHYRPWRPKEDFKILKTLEPEYNRLVFFDGLKFMHGANFPNDLYFGEEYRKNQVFFFLEDDEDDD
tara:strand:- start:110 stop:748 length:639 start_codon:yes stop_codon:yes gene_type:complete